jgi:hypothetical protein
LRLTCQTSISCIFSNMCVVDYKHTHCWSNHLHCAWGEYTCTGRYKTFTWEICRCDLVFVRKSWE